MDKLLFDQLYGYLDFIGRNIRKSSIKNDYLYKNIKIENNDSFINIIYINIILLILINCKKFVLYDVNYFNYSAISYRFRYVKYPDDFCTFPI